MLNRLFSAPPTWHQGSFCYKSLLFAFLLSFTLLSVAQDQTHEVAEILNKVDDLWRGKSSHAVTTMFVKTAHYQRKMKMESWSKGREKTLFRVIEPMREYGSATLKSDNHIYSYLPKTDRTIKLTSGMMMNAWMGSHLNYDDLVKEARLEEDYSAEISYRGQRQGQEVIEFSLIPKEDAAVVWGKRVLIILADSYIPVVEYYYDEQMKLARTIHFRDVALLAGQMRPTLIRVEPADKPEEVTELSYQALTLNISLSDRLFSLSQLKRH